MINKFSLDKKKAKEILPKRPKNANKGTFGRALIIAGSRKMVGCCELAVSGAFRCGVGLVTLAFPDCIYDTVTLRLTENTFMPLPSHNGELSKECITELLNEVNNFDVVVFGCGLGRSSDIKEILGELILKSRKPLIIDADGLNALAEIKEALKSAECDILLTPHPGEMSRLIKRNVDNIKKLYSQNPNNIIGLKFHPEQLEIAADSNVYDSYMQFAKEKKFDYFCTTLSISPHKNAQKLNEIGRALSNKYNVPYLFSDFKKKNGYKRSIELSKEYNLYRQDYCGCEFSKANSAQNKEK